MDNGLRGLDVQIFIRDINGVGGERKTITAVQN